MLGSLGGTVLLAQLLVASEPSSTQTAPRTGTAPVERQITTAQRGHILTNTGIWSPDGAWLVYDTRSTPAGDKFDGSTIEIVNVRTGETKVLYRAQRGARCGVATFHPRDDKVIFILGPEDPTPDWQYCAWHRQGVTVDVSRPDQALNLDACDISPPFTPGALRGGSHVHVWDPAGQWVSFTYEDHVLAQFNQETSEHEMNLRNVGVSAPIGAVRVQKDHPRNHDGSFFSVLATRTVAHPEPGSDQISRAYEEGWIGTNGYVRRDGAHQKHALAFQGQVLTRHGETISEVYVVDLPEDLTQQGDSPLAGTETRRPFPPKGTSQRRLTFTADRKYPGLQGPRHWLRSSPDGSRVAFLMKDDDGAVQLWVVSPCGGSAVQLTHNRHSIDSAFSWSFDGKFIAHVMDGSICVTDAHSGQTQRLTERAEPALAPRPEACVFSPDARQIACVRPVRMGEGFFNEIFVIRFAPDLGGM